MSCTTRTWMTAQISQGRRNFCAGEQGRGRLRFPKHLEVAPVCAGCIWCNSSELNLCGLVQFGERCSLRTCFANLAPALGRCFLLSGLSSWLSCWRCWRASARRGPLGSSILLLRDAGSSSPGAGQGAPGLGSSPRQPPAFLPAQELSFFSKPLLFWATGGSP